MDDLVKALNILVRRGDTSTAERLLDGYTDHCVNSATASAAVKELSEVAKGRGCLDAKQFIDRYRPDPREQRLLDVIKDNDWDTLLTLLRERRNWSTWSNATRARSKLPDPKHDRRWLRLALMEARRYHNQATIEFLVEHVDGARDVWQSLTQDSKCDYQAIVAEVISSDATPQLVRAIQAGDKQRVEELLSTERHYDAHLLLVVAANAHRYELFKLLAARFGAIETGR